MNEYQIELRVLRFMDRLHRELMSGEIQQDAYDAQVKVIADWADRQHDTPSSMIAPLTLPTDCGQE